MRKYIVGAIVGASLMFAVQAGAATLLGSTVDGIIQVKVDGENLGQAPVIDGVSYLPVRKLGGKTGYNVSFGEGVATLTTIEPTPVVSSEPLPSPAATVTPTHNYTLETIDGAIKNQEDAIHTATITVNAGIENGVSEEKKAKLLLGLENMYQELDRLKAIKVELQAK